MQQHDNYNRPIAVKVQNAYKAYGTGPPILSNFNMTVPRGTIYGLLGASGCGKTTMLSCIVGLRKLDKGDIWVYGAKPGTKESGIPGKTVGYMPQDIALYRAFTLQEILEYFGRLYGMSKLELHSRTEFLVNFLDIPDRHRLIESLSGGQQRRASLAVAMIHSPPLLILDEPTVGVDPLIRESIWEYLVDLVSARRTTVLITTHYIEEARQSHTVGLMRNGRLLMEKPPNDLLEEHQANLLEDIVLKLCKNDLNTNTNSNLTDEVSSAIEEMSFYNKKHRASISSGSGIVGISYNDKKQEDEESGRTKAHLYKRRQSVIETVNTSASRQADKVYALVIRNIRNLIRHPLFSICVLVIPAIQMIIFNTVVGHDPTQISFGLVNKEISSQQSFKDSCSNRTTECFAPEMSCDYLNEFNGSMDWNIFASEEAALRSVQQGKTWGYMIFSTNYTEHMKHRSLEKNFVSNETLRKISIPIRMDQTDQIKKNFMIKEISTNYLKFVKKMAVNCEADPRVVDVPLQFRAVYGALDTSLLEYMQPPQVLMNLFLLPMAVSIQIIWDKKAGTLDRTLVAGADFFHVILSLLITEGFLIIVELSLCLLIWFFIFLVNVKGSIALIFLLSFMTGICGLSFGFLFGSVCNNELEAIFLILFTYLPILVSSGNTWPREGLQPWVKSLTSILPLTYASDAIRSIVSRGWGLTHPNVWPGYVTIMAWTAFGVVASRVIYKLKH